MAKKLIYTIVFLIGLYVGCQALADVTATKFVELGGIALPAGSLIFAVTFTVRDLIHKRLGKEWAKAAIFGAAIFNVIQALYIALVAALPAPVWYPFETEWNVIFAIVPAITIASIIAEVISELIDTEVYHFWKNKFPKLPQWTRVAVSNAIALPIDSFIFAVLAFVLLPALFGAEAIPVMAALTLVLGQIVWKVAITIISMPGIYLVKDKPIALS